MSKKKKQKHGEEEGGEAWLLPYSDLMTLLLAVFIVLFAVSKMDQSKAEQISNSFSKISMINGSNGILPGKGDSINPDIIPGNGSSDEEMTDQELKAYFGATEMKQLSSLEDNVNTFISDNQLSDSLQTDIDTRGLVLTLNNAVLFDPGSAQIKNGSEETLFRIGKILSKLNNYIRIEGHTDNIPTNSSFYPTNWELSTARASSVIRLFIDNCDVQPDKIVAVGYGENRPVADNSTSDGRAKNRRIDIIIMSEKYNNLEKK